MRETMIASVEELAVSLSLFGRWPLAKCLQLFRRSCSWGRRSISVGEIGFRLRGRLLNTGTQPPLWSFFFAKAMPRPCSARHLWYGARHDAGTSLKSFEIGLAPGVE
jgi:hypothetical protein